VSILRTTSEMLINLYHELQVFTIVNRTKFLGNLIWESPLHLKCEHL